MNNLIRNQEHMQQVCDFNGMKFGSITPTDIDGFIEFRDKVYVFIETKFNNAELPLGQKLALERLCDVCDSAGKVCVGIVASHNTRNQDNIVVADLEVVRYRHKKTWHLPREKITVKEAVQKLIQKSGLKF